MVSKKHLSTHNTSNLGVDELGQHKTTSGFIPASKEQDSKPIIDRLSRLDQSGLSKNVYICSHSAHRIFIIKKKKKICTKKKIPVTQNSPSGTSIHGRVDYTCLPSVMFAVKLLTF